jgi:hypothetical protein
VSSTRCRWSTARRAVPGSEVSLASSRSVLLQLGLGQPPLQPGILSRYRASPNEVISRSMADSLRRKDFAYGGVVTPFEEAL